MVAAKHVFVLWSNPLFHESVERLLHHPDILYTGAADISKASIQDIQQQQPDVIIFENTGTPTMVEMVKLLVPGGNLHLIGFNLDENKIWSCQCGQRAILRAEDLVEMVLS